MIRAGTGFPSLSVKNIPQGGGHSVRHRTQLAILLRENDLVVPGSEASLHIPWGVGEAQKSPVSGETRGPVVL